MGFVVHVLHGLTGLIFRPPAKVDHLPVVSVEGSFRATHLVMGRVGRVPSPSVWKAPRSGD